MRKRGYCSYCGNFRTLSRDHIIPKKVIGSNALQFGNILYACGFCNASKSSLSLQNWLLSLPFYSPQHIYVPRFISMNAMEREEFKKMHHSILNHEKLN